MKNDVDHCEYLSNERLILFGGGPRPRQAIEKFVNWARQRRSTGGILIIGWASADASTAARELENELRSHRAGKIRLSLRAPSDCRQKAILLDQIRHAGGIFFSEGDQNILLRILRDPDIRTALLVSYVQGVPFGGSCAGAVLKQGMGLLPEVILEQNFVKQKRENQLFGAVLGRPDLLGIGVNEGAALVVSKNRHAEVLDGEKVMIVDAKTHPGSLLVDVLKPGESFDIVKRSRIRPAS